MQAKIKTLLRGIDTTPVDVQVHLSNGLPSMPLLVLLTKLLLNQRNGSGRAFIHGSGTAPKRIAINLAPADLAKEGSHYDLPIALGLMAMGVLPADSFDGMVVLGELSLDGSIAPVHGVLSAAIGASQKIVA